MRSAVLAKKKQQKLTIWANVNYLLHTNAETWLTQFKIKNNI